MDLTPEDPPDVGERTPLIKPGIRSSSTSRSDPYTEAVGLWLESSTIAFDPAFTSRFVHKIDRRLIPIMFTTFCVKFIDKTLLTSASVYGLADDIDLKGNRYNIVAAMFYFGYLAWDYPSTVLIQRLPVAKYVGVVFIGWGVVIGITAACNTYAQLLVARFLTGALEAAISPAFLYITSMWYTREEAPSRMVYWYAGNCCGGAIANLLSWSLGHIMGSVSPWRWMYLTLGITAVIWGLILLLLLPDTIASAKFLNAGEKLSAESRVIHNVTGIPSDRVAWNRKEAVAALLDPKAWFIFVIAISSEIPAGGFQNFVNIALKGFGFTTFESSLVPLPISASSLIIMLVSGWLASRKKDVTTILIATMLLPPIIGNILMNCGPTRGVKLLGLYTISFANGILPLNMSLISGNIRSVTQKMTMTSLMLVAFCGGNIIGPQLFKASEAPHYPTTYIIFACTYALGAISSLGLRFYLKWENRKLDAEERPATPPTPVLEFHRQTSEPEIVYPVLEHEEVKGFRYRL